MCAIPNVGCGDELCWLEICPWCFMHTLIHKYAHALINKGFNLLNICKNSLNYKNTYHPWIMFDASYSRTICIFQIQVAVLDLCSHHVASHVALAFLAYANLLHLVILLPSLLSFSICEKEFRGMFPMPQQKILRILNKCSEVSFIKGIFVTLGFFLQSSGDDPIILQLLFMFEWPTVTSIKIYKNMN